MDSYERKLMSCSKTLIIYDLRKINAQLREVMIFLESEGLPTGPSRDQYDRLSGLENASDNILEVIEKLEES